MGDITRKWPEQFDDKQVKAPVGELKAVIGLVETEQGTYTLHIRAVDSEGHEFEASGIQWKPRREAAFVPVICEVKADGNWIEIIERSNLLDAVTKGEGDLKDLRRKLYLAEAIKPCPVCHRTSQGVPEP